MSKASVFLALIAASIAVTSAISDAERASIKEYMMPILASCGQEFGVKREDLIAAKEAKNIDGVDGCFASCFYKKIGVFNDEGLLDLESAKAQNSKFLSSEEDRQMIDGLAHKCLYVNEATVSDGAKGCERAKLLLACMIKEKSPFGPF